MKCEVDFTECDLPIEHWYMKISTYSKYKRVFGYCNKHRPDVVRTSPDFFVRPLDAEEAAVYSVMND